jgi:prevent-host-death family protein
MGATVSATEARVHFGELLERLLRDGEPVVVARGGRPVAVMLSLGEYERLSEGQRRAAWQDALEEAQEARARAGKNLKRRAHPGVEEVLDAVREERDASLTRLR